MTGPVRLDVFSDYLCPWCYNAAVRLSDLARDYGDRLEMRWRAFPLIPDERPGRLATAATQEGRRRVQADEPRARFVAPAIDTPLPASSIPAMTAAKCAERQGAALFERFHHRLFTAHFEANLDIGRPDVLRSLAVECGLDVLRFERDYAGEEAYQDALRDYAEGAAWFGVSAIPTVVFNEKLSLVGAVSAERYRALLDWILAGEPGGVIPLTEPASGASPPGQSTVTRQNVVGGQST
jgi:predicted DsbA family dithiol-disulfide isomerase